MTIRTQTRQVGPLTLRADVSKVDAENRTFDITWSVGAKVLRTPWWGDPYYEELSMDPAHVRMGRLNNGAPFLTDHDGARVVEQAGVVESASVKAGVGSATVRLAKAGIDPAVDMLFAKIQDKIVRNLSVGYRTYKAQKLESVDEKIPTIRAVDWEPYEISAVTMGADDAAKFRSAGPMNEIEIVEVSTRGIPPITQERNGMDPEELKKIEEQKKREADAALEKRAQEIAEQKIKAENERVHGIKHAVRTAKLDEKFGEKLVTDKVTVDKAREMVLEELAKRDDASAVGSPIGDGTNTTRVERGEEDLEKWTRGAEAGLLSRTGELAKLDNDKVLKSNMPGVRHAFRGFDPNETGGEFRTYSLLDLARVSLERRGVRTVGKSSMQIVEMALAQRDIGGSNTISDFAVVLENVMYKILLGRYATIDDTWRSFCGVDSVQDFRSSNRYRLGSFGTLDTLTESGEYKTKSIPDGVKFSLTTETRGNKIAVSRQAIINDDMGAISEMAGAFGRMAGLSIEKSVYDLLATAAAGLGPNVTISGATHALFDAAWGNIGSGAALSMASLEADRVLMTQQKDPNSNEYLSLQPAVLLVPESLRAQAMVLNNARFDPTAASAFEAPNYVNGLYKQIISTPRLTGTRRYSFSDPGNVAAIKVVFLNGAQTPFMDQRVGFDIDGLEWKLRLDMKAQAHDPKGALTNAGT